MIIALLLLVVPTWGKELNTTASLTENISQLKLDDTRWSYMLQITSSNTEKYGTQVKLENLDGHRRRDTMLVNHSYAGKADGLGTLTGLRSHSIKLQWSFGSVIWAGILCTIPQSDRDASQLLCLAIWCLYNARWCSEQIISRVMGTTSTVYKKHF